jgi:hypothetical protein
MTKFKIYFYDDKTLSEIISNTPELNIIAIDKYSIDENNKEIIVLNSNENLITNQISILSFGEDIRLNNLLPEISLYKDFIKTSSDPLRSRTVLDLMTEYNIQDILIFYKQVSKNKRIYISFLINHNPVMIAQYFLHYKKISDSLFVKNNSPTNKNKLIHSSSITKELPKSLTSKELQILSLIVTIQLKSIFT